MVYAILTRAGYRTESKSPSASRSGSNYTIGISLEKLETLLCGMVHISKRTVNGGG